MTSISEVEVFLDCALREPFGIKLCCPTADDAVRLRRRLYAVRSSLRRKGNHEYDQLKFRIMGNEVWPISKNALNQRNSKPEQVTSSRPLTMEDLETLPKPPFVDPTKRIRKE